MYPRTCPTPSHFLGQPGITLSVSVPDTAWSRRGGQRHHDLCLTPELSGLAGEGGASSLGIRAP